jgi:glucosamine 6-phosphate synthetase-like amidotransferase/phosphosugar isomerase protein
MYRHFRDGMPDTLDGARAWLAGEPLPERKPLPTVDVDKNLEQTIAEHRVKVAQARQIWGALMDAGDEQQARAQTSYNQSLKTLVALEAELERRAIQNRDTIQASESKQAMADAMARVLDAWEKMPSICCEEANPKNPAVAMAAMAGYIRKMRKELSA